MIPSSKFQTRRQEMPVFNIHIFHTWKIPDEMFHDPNHIAKHSSHQVVLVLYTAQLGDATCLDMCCP